MAIELISKIKPKNSGSFPLVDAADVEMPDGTRLSEFKGGGASITVDNAFNAESENPVQNKVITAAIGEAQVVMQSMQQEIASIPTTVETYVEQYVAEALGGEY